MIHKMLTLFFSNTNNWRYIPSDEIIMEVIDEQIDGDIEDEITGDVRECDR